MKAKDTQFLHADNLDSDQSSHMRRLNCVFVGRTYQQVCFYTPVDRCVIATLDTIAGFLSEKLHFSVVKVSIYLNRRVFVMSGKVSSLSAHAFCGPAFCFSIGIFKPK